MKELFAILDIQSLLTSGETSLNQNAGKLENIITTLHKKMKKSLMESFIFCAVPVLLKSESHTIN